jgi:hypothetical protein
MNVPMNTNRILLLSFGCFISAASYASVSDSSSSDEFSATPDSSSSDEFTAAPDSLSSDEFTAAPDSSSSGEFTAAASAQRPFACNRFSPEEDQQLRELVAQHGINNYGAWMLIASHMPGRSSRVCRERWRNYLSSDLNSSPWSPKKDALLLQKYQEFGPKWTQIATFFTGRTDVNCRKRWHFLQKRTSSTVCKYKKFSPEEDQRLRKLVVQHGTKWRTIAHYMPNRSSGVCQNRWHNHLNLNFNPSPWTPEEDALLEQKFKEIGPKWARIATFFTDRTDVNCKNRWNTLQRRIPKAQQRRRGRPISAIPKAQRRRRRPISAQPPQPLPQVLDDDSVLLSPLPLQQNNFDLDSFSPYQTDDDLKPLDDDSMLLQL